MQDKAAAGGAHPKGSGGSHLHHDDPAQILSGASQKLFYVGPVTSPGEPNAGSGDPAYNGHWQLVIQATKFVTHEVIEVWTSTQTGGNDPTGLHTRTSGHDPLAALTIEPAP